MEGSALIIPSSPRGLDSDMSNEHVDHLLYELARAAMLARISKVSHELWSARENRQTDLIPDLQSQSSDLWQELRDLTSRAPRACASAVRKYSTDTVRAQRALRDLNKLRSP